MQDNDSGSEQQGSWQPPEYVSPWIPASGSAPDGGGTFGADGTSGSGDTISFGAGNFGGEGEYAASGQPRYGYGEPGYGQSGYSQPPQGGYGAWSDGPGGQPPWGGYGAPPPPPPPPGSHFGRFLTYVAVAALAAGAGAGAAIALNHTDSSSSALSPQNVSPTGNSGQQNPFFGGNGSGGTPSGQNGTSGGNASGPGSLNAQALAAKVDPGIVDITSQLDNATAEGTGMIISPSGLVLTNNHVIDGATAVSATLVVSDKTYTAQVLGYDATDDVALLQLRGASGLQTVSLGNSGQVKVGQAVLALGNAGGRGGLPATAQGAINALNRTIQASDQGANTIETLHGMLQTNAPIQEGDSGGPLVNSGGKVIGMDTAANTSGFSADQSGATSTTGFAIPINHAISIVNQIAAGHASDTVHIGLAGFIGINVADAGSTTGCAGNGGLGGGFGGGTPPVSSGALICQVVPGTPAASAGLANGDVITSVNGQSVGTQRALTSLLAGDHPGDKLAIGYVDSGGAQHSASVTLGAIAR